MPTRVGWLGLSAAAGTLLYVLRRRRGGPDVEIRLPNGITVREDSPGLAQVIYDQVVDYFEHPDGGAPPTIFREGMVVVDVGMDNDVDINDSFTGASQLAKLGQDASPAISELTETLQDV